MWRALVRQLEPICSGGTSSIQTGALYRPDVGEDFKFAEEYQRLALIQDISRVLGRNPGQLFGMRGENELVVYDVGEREYSTLVDSGTLKGLKVELEKSQLTVVRMAHVNHQRTICELDNYFKSRLHPYAYAIRSADCKIRSDLRKQPDFGFQPFNRTNVKRLPENAAPTVVGEIASSQPAFFAKSFGHPPSKTLCEKLDDYMTLDSPCRVTSAWGFKLFYEGHDEGMKPDQVWVLYRQRALANLPARAFQVLLDLKQLDFTKPAKPVKKGMGWEKTEGSFPVWPIIDLHPDIVLDSVPSDVKPYLHSPFEIDLRELADVLKLIWKR